MSRGCSIVGVAFFLVTVLQAPILHAQDAPEVPDGPPILRLYSSDESERRDELRLALQETATALGLSYADHDMADEEVFRGLLQLETERGITQFANVELFAGERYVAGAGEVLHFLNGLRDGTVSLDAQSSEVGSLDAGPTQVGADGQPPRSAGPAEQGLNPVPGQGGAYRTQTVPGPVVQVNVSPFQFVYALFVKNSFAALGLLLTFLGGLFLGGALMRWRMRRNRAV